MGRRLGDGESKAPGNAWPAWPVCHSASDWGMPVPDLFKVLDQARCGSVDAGTLKDRAAVKSDQRSPRVSQLTVPGEFLQNLSEFESWLRYSDGRS